MHNRFVCFSITYCRLKLEAQGLFTYLCVLMYIIKGILTKLNRLRSCKHNCFTLNNVKAEYLNTYKYTGFHYTVVIFGTYFCFIYTHVFCQENREKKYLQQQNLKVLMTLFLHTNKLLIGQTKHQYNLVFFPP